MGSSVSCCLEPEVEQKQAEKIKTNDKNIDFSDVDQENPKNETWVDLRMYGIDFDKVNRQKMEQTLSSEPKIEQKQAENFKTNDEFLNSKNESYQLQDDGTWSLVVNVSDSDHSE